MRILKGPRSSVTAIAFSPNGRLLAVGHHNRLNVWDTTTGTIAEAWVPEGYCHGLAFSPDSRHLAALVFGPECRPGGGSDLFVWALAKPQDPLLQGTGVDAPLWFHPDGSWLLTWRCWNPPARWELADGTRREAWPTASWAVEDYRYRNWVLGTRGHHLHRIENLEEAGQRFYHLDLIDPASGELLRTLKTPPHHRPGGYPFLLPGDRHLVVFARRELIVDDLVEGCEVLRRNCGRKEIYRVAIALAGDKLIAASGSKEVQVWTPPDWAEPLDYSWPIGTVTCLALAPDGQRAAAGGSSGQVIIWDLDA
jgi:WD40 repeat protein